MVCKVVCVLMLYGFLVAAYPTGGSDGDTFLEIPIEGAARFTGSVSMVGQYPCPPVVLNPLTPAALESDDNEFVENNESCSIYDEEDESDYNVEVPKEVVLGALLAGAITAVKGAEINATLAEIDAFVETELGKIDTLIESSGVNLDISEVECVDSILTGIKSQITTELDSVDDLVDSEIVDTEIYVEDLVDNLETTICLNKGINAQTNTAKLADKKAVVELELGILEPLVDSLLKNTESVVDLELNKVNELVESELAKVDVIVKVELEKMDLFVETELAKTDALVKSEIAKLDCFVEAELAKVSVKDIINLTGVVAATTKTSQCGNYEPDLFPEEEFYDDSITYDDIDDNDCNVAVGETFSTVTPATGGCKMTRFFPCDNRSPLPNSVSPIPTTETICNYMQNGESGVVSRMRILPAVKLRNRVADDQNQNQANIDGILEFNGVAKATGFMTLFNQFPCPILTPTQVGPDGKKYIWIAPTKPVKPQPKLPKPIADSTTNYETEDVDEDIDVDYEMVAGEVSFEGIAPACGSVSIKGQTN